MCSAVTYVVTLDGERADLRQELVQVRAVSHPDRVDHWWLLSGPGAEADDDGATVGDGHRELARRRVGAVRRRDLLSALSRRVQAERTSESDKGLWAALRRGLNH